MSDDRGLLGSLPKTRPGVESPRRAAAREAAAAKQTAGAGAAAGTPPTPEAPPGSSGFEDLARAGIGLAGGAAAVGFRLAGRAVGEIGKAVGRR